MACPSSGCRAELDALAAAVCVVAGLEDVRVLAPGGGSDPAPGLVPQAATRATTTTPPRALLRKTDLLASTHAEPTAYPGPHVRIVPRSDSAPAKCRSSARRTGRNEAGRCCTGGDDRIPMLNSYESRSRTHQSRTRHSVLPATFNPRPGNKTRCTAREVWFGPDSSAVRRGAGDVQ